MGLPQELIDYIMDMFCEDLPALKAGSLTCQAMFASTRHLIHRTLYLTGRNQQSVLSREENFRNRRRPHEDDLKLHLLSYMGEHGLLKYSRRVYIRMVHLFTPDALQPHLHHFQSLDRVHTLIIEEYNAAVWANHYKTSFLHFYPTLTSLALVYPLGHHRLLLQFILQFPNLENLCIEWPESLQRPRPTLSTFVAIGQSPPFRGHLRLVGYRIPFQWSMEFPSLLPDGINFRSIELEKFSVDDIQHVLNACAHSLEHLIIVPHLLGEYASNLAPLIGY